MNTNTECARRRAAGDAAYRKMLRETIPVNIWDDYWDDDSGKPQETHAYVEDHELNEELKYRMLKVVYAHLLTADLPGVRMCIKFPPWSLLYDSRRHQEHPA